jgi:hypothetical protein
MDQATQSRTRILAVAPTTRGLGYVVMEGPDEILANGCKRAKGEGKNIQALAQVEKLMRYWKPSILALQDVNAKGSKRVPRIKELHADLEKFAESQKVRVKKFSGSKLRKVLINNSKGTKHEMATEIARRFPEELGDILPAKRRAWDDEDERMGIFDAAALAVSFWR